MSNSTDDSGSGVVQGIQGWFPGGQQDMPGWRLDAVSLLAVIGESSIAEHAQVVTASSLCLLPRIIPAPQALLKPSRPTRLPEFSAKLTGVYSGVNLETVGFFANIIHPLEGLQPFTFRVYRISHAYGSMGTSGTSTSSLAPPPLPPRDRSWSSWWRSLLRRQPARNKRRSLPAPATAAAEEGDHKRDDSGTDTGQGAILPADVERGDEQPLPQPGMIRRRTIHETVTDLVVDPTMSHRKNSSGPKQQQQQQQDTRPALPPALYSPVHILSLVSFLLTIGIIVASAYWQDGTAILAVGLVSCAGSVVCYASWWRPILMSRSHKGKVPPGDVVIRTREGAFTLIRCTEEVARELYSGTEECEYYVSEQLYRVLMGVGTILLMVAVVLLGNCNWNAQVFIGAGYIMLNGFYWGLGLLPKRYFWDLSRYDIEEITPAITEPDLGPHATKSFTSVLWQAIYETGRTGWVERSGAAPGTDQWKRWLREAEDAYRRGDDKWPAVARKDEIMKGDEVDHAKQRAPIDAIDAEKPSLPLET